MLALVRFPPFVKWRTGSEKAWTQSQESCFLCLAPLLAKLKKPRQNSFFLWASLSHHEVIGSILWWQAFLLCLPKLKSNILATTNAFSITLGWVIESKFHTVIKHITFSNMAYSVATMLLISTKLWLQYTQTKKEKARVAEWILKNDFYSKLYHK